MTEVAQLVCRLTGAAAALEHVALPIDDPVRRQPDTRLASQLLHWHPQIQLEDGLIRTISAFRDELETAS